ncbi:hypothetical protein ACMC56_13150 [Campylobacterota bacterium DY0563]
MSLLRSIEDKFESLSLRLKIEIFLFPLIIILLLSYLFYDTNNESTTIVKLDKKIIDVRMKDSYIKLLKQIEEFSLKNNITINFIKRDYRNIKLTLISNPKNLFLFLDFIERFNNFSKIETMSLSENKLSLDISFKKFYQKKPYTALTSKNLKIKKQNSFVLKAIVGNEVLINNIWIKKDDFIEGYKLVDIFKNKVFLKNDNEKIFLKLHKDEKI